MYCFYDLETSSKELLGQILSYAFIITDLEFNIKTELHGFIKLNKTQLPDIEALLANKLHLTFLTANGAPEYLAAQKIYSFFNQCLHQYNQLTLIGYNSNSFDLDFLRNLLIRYGYNPYFEGKLINLDILHFAQHLAFNHPHNFPWVSKKQNQSSYYSFKLEDLAKAFDLLQTSQSHDAREDVLLTIKLIKKLTTTFQSSLLDFSAIAPSFTSLMKAKHQILKQKIRHFVSSEQTPDYFIYQYWLILYANHKYLIALDLLKYQALIKENPHPTEPELLTCLRYLNAHKHFFILESLSKNETSLYLDLVTNALAQPFLKTINPSQYFKLTAKNWDIEYQIYKLGFDHIPTLHTLSTNLITQPQSYEPTLQSLIKTRTSAADNYLIQLYNRVYLNFHPQVPLKHYHKYLLPRYVTGTLLKNPESFIPLKTYAQNLENILNSPEYDQIDKNLIQTLNTYFLNFCKTFDLKY
jgi:DNA polymerase III epsilon subunit-like protein